MNNAGRLAAAMGYLFLMSCNGSQPAPVPPEASAAPVASVPGTTIPVTTSSAAEPSSDLRKDGASCSSSEECASGICQGQGCGADEGACASQTMRCKRDRQAFCGCDNETFHASSNCPMKRYASTGPCAPPEG